MLYVVCLISLATAASALILLLRLRNVDAARPAPGETAPHRFLECLARFLAEAADASLLLPAGRRGLGDLPVRFREAQDPYHTAAELRAAIAALATTTDTDQLPPLVKACYQL